jgi:uncharacterized membrane protein (UPF0136 family)
LPVGTVAWRMNACSAICTAASAAGVVAIGMELGSDAATAVFAALAFALGATVSSGALVANAQILAGPCAIGALLGCLIVARSGDRRALVAACALGGFGIAAHPSAVWVVPAIAVTIAWQRRRIALGTLAIACAALLLPLALYAYLPLRSSIVAAQGLDPSAQPPVELPGGIDWDTNSPRTLDGLLDELLGRREGAGSSLASAFDPRAFPAAAVLWFDLARRQYAAIVLVLALAGAVTLAFRDRRALSVLAAGTFGGVLFANAYATDTHIDRYVFVSFAVCAALVAATVRLVTRRIGPIELRHVVALVLVVVLVQTSATHPSDATGPQYDDGAAIVAAVAHDTPGDAIVVAQWNDAAALGYGAFVQHALGERVIVSAWPGTYGERYAGWARTRPVILYASRLAMLHGIARPPGARLHELPSSRFGYWVFAVVPIGRNATARHAGRRDGLRVVAAATW